MADAVPAETLSDKLTNVPQLEELEVVERGVVSLMETASQALISLSSIDTLNQAELETQCTDYLTLLEQIRNSMKFAEASALSSPPVLTGSVTSHVEWLRFDLVAARTAAVGRELGGIVDELKALERMQQQQHQAPASSHRS